eukprot:TRINITY_DN18991_c0_g1_i1.p1 TRINITY_DN18991_c0_g1~~TRINITY_DN18991_c0_g1_i1.p1  ORF type:complete len:186 (-),score=14.68 TRINITY_DN18991_c0_g1_i1:111-668(-)
MADEHSLIEVVTINPRIRLDIRYATTNNFTNQVVYQSARCFARRPVAAALDKVQQDLEKRNLGLKIYDGYRPLSVQRIFWSLVPDETYVADPNKGSRHNRGCAVDLTLVDSDGNELEMPTGFDDFAEKAWRSCMELPAKAIENRQLLASAMEKHGFTGFPNEWWHFDFIGWENFPILDVPFEQLG